MKKIKYILSGVLIGVVISSTIPVIAKSTHEMINVIYKNIKVCVDGKEIDTAGNEPFIYNGRTYLPVKAISEAVGKPVNWDGKTNTVYIENYVNSKNSSSFDLEPYEFDNYRFEMYLDGKSFSVAGVKRTNGFVIEGFNGIGGYALFNLDGKYNTMTFNLGHVDGTEMADTTINIYLDGKMLQEIEIGAEDMFKNFVVPLNGATQMKITRSGSGSAWSSQYGFFDVKLY